MNPYGVSARPTPTYDAAELAAWTAEVEKARLAYHGEVRVVELKPKTARTTAGPTCMRPTCDSAPHRRGLCHKHYRHLRARETR